MIIGTIMQHLYIYACRLVGIHVSNDLLSPGVVVETEQLTSWQHFRFTVSTKARLRVSTSIGDITNEMFPNAVECRQQAKIEFQLKRGECNCPEACRYRMPETLESS